MCVIIKKNQIEVLIIMVKLTKECNNCHLTIDIDPENPLARCPFCGENLSYSLEETKQIKIAENQEPGDGTQKTLALKGSSFTVSKQKSKITNILLRVAAVVVAMIFGYFVISLFTRDANIQQENYSEKASAESSTNKATAAASPIKQATPTNTPKPTSTPVPQIKAPALAEKYIGRKYEEVRMDFRSAGFTNIVLYPLHDMTIDIFAGHVGNVESISIDGNIDYDLDTLYPVNAVVKISYHSLK